MDVNFRQRARDSVARARAEMGCGDSERLKYVALELRMAIEAVTYERAQSYKADLPPSMYLTWQPKRLMQELLEIEPLADKSASIAFGIEEVPGQPAKEMTYLGAEKVFDLKAIKTHYDALGSYLHMPTMKQIQDKGGLDIEKLRGHCIEILNSLEAVLSSSVFNINFSRFSSIDCMNEGCGKPVRKRIPNANEVLKAVCFECNAEYEIKAGGEGKWEWRPLLEDVDCPTDHCSQKLKIWQHQIKPGSCWRCSECGGLFKIGLGIYRDTEQPISSES